MQTPKGKLDSQMRLRLAIEARLMRKAQRRALWRAWQQIISVVAGLAIASRPVFIARAGGSMGLRRLRHDYTWQQDPFMFGVLSLMHVLFGLAVAAMLYAWISMFIYEKEVRHDEVDP